MHDRRNNPRLLCADLVPVRWKDASGKPRKSVANLEDISVNGACLQMDIDVPAETVMRIAHQKGELIGTVKYCEFREFGYFLGLQFNEGTQWSMEEFRPQHLLDPRRLVERKAEEPPKNESFGVLPSTRSVF
jgi:hypothetical protein